MQDYGCFETTINLINSNGATQIGTFTGSVSGRDMQRVDEIRGIARFESSRMARRINLRDLHIDMTADGKRVFCLFFDNH